MDSRFAMGHVVIRRKRTVVGDEAQYVILFRCIQSMDSVFPYNTCYTGGALLLFITHCTLYIAFNSGAVRRVLSSKQQCQFKV